VVGEAGCAGQATEMRLMYKLAAGTPLIRLAPCLQFLSGTASLGGLHLA